MLIRWQALIFIAVFGIFTTLSGQIWSDLFDWIWPAVAESVLTIVAISFLVNGKSGLKIFAAINSDTEALVVRRNGLICLITGALMATRTFTLVMSNLQYGSDKFAAGISMCFTELLLCLFLYIVFFFHGHNSAGEKISSALK